MKIIDSDDSPKLQYSVKRVIAGNIVLEGLTVEGPNAEKYFLKVLDKLASKQKQSNSASSFDASPSSLLLLEEAIEKYREDIKRERKGLSGLIAVTHTLSILASAVGNIPVAQINQDHIRSTLDSFRWWPSNAKAKKEFRGLSATEILNIGRTRPPVEIAASTYNNHLARICAFFNRLADMEVIASSPCKGVNTRVNTSTMQSNRRPLRPAELAAIFNPEEFKKWVKQRPERWWVPQLCLYTGARANEIAQLQLADIAAVDGISCIAIRVTNKGQTVKNKSSIRVIPLAKPLIDAGFLTYVEEVKATGHPRLFPHLAAGHTLYQGDAYYRGYGEKVIQDFCKRLKEMGFEKGVGVHAFRHTFSTNLTKHGIGVADIALITGHTIQGAKPDSVTVPGLQTYIDRNECPPELRAIYATISQFNPGIDLPAYTPGQFAKAFSKKNNFKK
ncbi:site-specific integrase [Xanthomonas translucens]|uniref:site-specific integrase n=2 Tax=Xanthomonas campestris pv. translucens TaxID=343 RepID=UPI00272A26B3|nr:site-specific integrase [Xanthomonas translucens]WLA11584.1 site-specific integrase [Xanthomonas translucens]